MSSIDLTHIRDIIAETASSEIMPRFRNLGPSDIEMKGKDDPVTIADQATEKILTARFRDFLPGSFVVGEEAVAKDKNILSHLAGAAPLWIIDPIDGTRNFVAGTPEFAVMVALLIKGRPVASWIHDPVSRDTIMAEEGAGVWLRDKRLRLASKDPGILTAGLVGARVKALLEENDLHSRPELPALEVGSCAGFDYPRLFAGEAVFANSASSRAGFLLYRHTNPWDHMPGLFLHQEAGGYHANWKGKPYNMAERRAGLLSARDREEWTRLYGIFEPLIRHIVEKDCFDG